MNDSMFSEQDYFSRSRDEEAFHDVRARNNKITIVSELRRRCLRQ